MEWVNNPLYEEAIGTVDFSVLIILFFQGFSEILARAVYKTTPQLSLPSLHRQFPEIRPIPIYPDIWQATVSSIKIIIRWQNIPNNFITIIDFYMFYYSLIPKNCNTSPWLTLSAAANSRGSFVNYAPKEKLKKLEKVIIGLPQYHMNSFSKRQKFHQIKEVPMKKYRKEIILSTIQFILFYLLPFFAGPTDMMGMVVVLLFSTLILSILMGILSGRRIKYAFPPFTALLFLPSVFIHYNETALPQCIWYLVISLIGLFIGCVIRFFFK